MISTISKQTEKIQVPSLAYLDIFTDKIHYNLTPEKLTELTLKNNMGILSENGTLCIRTGKFTGRSPKNRFIVKDSITKKTVDWNEINQPFSKELYNRLYFKLTDYLQNKELFVRDVAAGADINYQMKVRVVTEFPWSNQFVHNMFLRLDESKLTNFTPDWTVICAPNFEAIPLVDGTPQKNFSIINFSKKEIIIGGTGYTGEIKKGIFSVLNYTLPTEKQVLSMHCSSNIGKAGDTAVFFGLSGTGKTTLSADPERQLIGDDEHGWSENGVFNFEGGCYAKCIDLTPEKEPDIYRAIKPGAILENITFIPGTRKPDFASTKITQNTRVSYPIHHIENRAEPSVGGIPKNIFFLTCDAFGVLPPISKLTAGQAMYHFISGYTAKVAGTEVGVAEPQTTFSACFGAPFLPLHPCQYADMLGEKLAANDVNVWLVNTGWTGGAYGKGNRMKLKYTRAMISAALDGQLAEVEYQKDKIFDLSMPTTCPNVPDEVLNPRNTWSDKTAYDQKAKTLAAKFIANFKQFEDRANDEILKAAPSI